MRALTELRRSPKANLDVGSNIYPYIADKNNMKEIEELLNNFYDVKSDAQVEALNKYAAIAKRAAKLRCQANK